MADIDRMMPNNVDFPGKMSNLWTKGVGIQKNCEKSNSRGSILKFQISKEKA